jgi:hypothetical protein
VFEVEQHERGLGDRADAPWIEADPPKCGEGLFEQRVGAFGDAVHATDDLVVCGLRFGRLTALGLFVRVADGGEMSW